MGAYHNVLRGEGSRGDLLTALEKEWENVATLEAQLAAAQADSARLDWLEAGDGMPGACTDCIALGYNLQGKQASLRAAIDTAREK